MLQEMLRVGVNTKAVKIAELKTVIADTTVAEKAISYPTDAKLYQIGRKWLVRLAKNMVLN